MGCDIHIWAERKSDNGYEVVTGDFSEGPAPFDWRSYGMYGFLADVRNYSDVPPISEPRGLPDDASSVVREECEEWDVDGHSHSWLSVAEIDAFDYNQDVEDRRVTLAMSWGLDGGCTAAPGGGRMTTYREFLGQDFFDDLAKLKACGADRIVFWFDN